MWLQAIKTRNAWGHRCEFLKKINYLVVFIYFQGRVQVLCNLLENRIEYYIKIKF